MRNYLYPRIPLDHLGVIVRITLLGAVIAGMYGALHDQVSYSISPEYFTKLKFHQFSYLNFGWHPRVFASAIGLLATWWVGMIAGWMLARMGLAEIPMPARRKCTVRAFAIVMLVTATFGLVGAMLGLLVTHGPSSVWWSSVQCASRWMIFGVLSSWLTCTMPDILGRWLD